MYFRDVLKLSPKQRQEKLEEFCSKHLQDFNVAKHYLLIDKSLKRGSNKTRNFIVVPKVDITKCEFDYITGLDIDINCKKVLFAFLVDNKVRSEVHKIKYNKEFTNVCFKGGKSKYREIQKSACIPSKLNINDDIIFDLSQINLIKPLHQGLIELTFIKEIPHNDETVLFSVSDFDIAGLYFDYYTNNKKVRLCKECGRPFRIKSNRQEYCSLHSPADLLKDKVVACVDCGVEFTAPAKANNIKRCEECRHIKQLELQRLSMKNNKY